MVNFLSFLNKMIYSFTKEAAYVREQNAMHAFLGQATDRYHLEQLEREWDKKRIKIFGY